MSSHFSKTPTALRYFACLVALGFGTGLLQAIPGTLATFLVGIPLYYLFSKLPYFCYAIILLASFILGIFACSIAEEVLENPDDPAIVWDEICGYLFTMMYAPQGLLWVLLGFFLFRCFDILKPFPINLIDKNLKGGVGIMLDDILAAAYAKLALYFIAHAW
jgi:phosphatidylglycerophosphatase A